MTTRRGADDAFRDALATRAREDLRLARRAPWFPKPAPSPGEPSPDTHISIPQIIANLIGFERAGRQVAAAVAIAVLRERYEALRPDDLQADEGTWPDFVRKHLPFPPERVQELLGRMVHRGGMLRCTKCGTEVRCPCSCGAPYIGTHRWAAGAPVLAADRAVVALTSHPEKSNRAIAAEIGVSEQTVRRARQKIKNAREAMAQ